MFRVRRLSKGGCSFLGVARVEPLPCGGVARAEPLPYGGVARAEPLPYEWVYRKFYEASPSKMPVNLL